MKSKRLFDKVNIPLLSIYVNERMNQDSNKRGVGKMKVIVIVSDTERIP